jgi:hypothetical protein
MLWPVGRKKPHRLMFKVIFFCWRETTSDMLLPSASAAVYFFKFASRNLRTAASTSSGDGWAGGPPGGATNV